MFPRILSARLLRYLSSQLPSEYGELCLTSGGVLLEQLHGPAQPQLAALHGDLLFVLGSAGDSGLHGASPQKSQIPASQGSSLMFQVCYNIKNRRLLKAFLCLLSSLVCHPKDSTELMFPFL